MVPLPACSPRRVQFWRAWTLFQHSEHPEALYPVCLSLHSTRQDYTTQGTSKDEVPAWHNPLGTCICSSLARHCSLLRAGPCRPHHAPATHIIHWFRVGVYACTRGSKRIVSGCAKIPLRTRCLRSLRNADRRRPCMCGLESPQRCYCGTRLDLILALLCFTFPHQSASFFSVRTSLCLALAYHSDRASLRKNLPVWPPSSTLFICVSMNGVRAPSSGVSVPRCDVMSVSQYPVLVCKQACV